MVCHPHPLVFDKINAKRPPIRYKKKMSRSQERYFYVIEEKGLYSERHADLLALNKTKLRGERFASICVIKQNMEW